MKISCLLLVSLSVTSIGFPQEPAKDPGPPMAASGITAPQRTDAELEQLLGPIALYPDALLALILPATTAPADVVLAARQMRGNNNDRSQVELRAWDDSVKALTHYPDVLNWLDDNLEWTKQVGEAFLAQPSDVMNTLQRLRNKARAAGTLIDTPQQQIISSTDVIRIVPAQRDIIYVPTYEPSVVYVDRPVYYPVPPLSFGIGVPVGAWLAYDCDWGRRKVLVGDRHRRWNGHDWRRPVVSPDAPAHDDSLARHWQPSRSRTFVGPVAPHNPVVTPDTRVGPSIPGSPRQPPGARRDRGFSNSRRATPPPVAVAPALPLEPTRPDLRSNSTASSRSLPNVISRHHFPVAPPLPMTLPSAPVMREMGPTVAPGLSERNIAPSRPFGAPSLPAVVPSFSEPPNPVSGPPAHTPAPDRAPLPERNHRTGRQLQLD